MHAHHHTDARTRLVRLSLHINCLDHIANTHTACADVKDMFGSRCRPKPSCATHDSHELKTSSRSFSPCGREWCLGHTHFTSLQAPSPVTMLATGCRSCGCEVSGVTITTLTTSRSLLALTCRPCLEVGVSSKPACATHDSRKLHDNHIDHVAINACADV